MASAKQHLKAELIKCYQDPEHFIRNYCYIKHPLKGMLLFSLYDFQVKILGQLSKDQNIIILKSRQLGISTLVSAYSLWEMVFNENRVILSLATDRHTATNLIDKIKYMYDHLPKWMAVPSVTKNKSTLELKNGSKVVCKSSNPDSARSEAASILVFDEAAFIENMEDTFTAAQPTLSTGGRCIALSTPNGKGNWFHQTWVKAEASENTFLPIPLDYKVHPEFDDEWRKRQDKDLGEKRAAQECDAHFLSSGDTVFAGDLIEEFRNTMVTDPIEKTGPNGSLWVWQHPDMSKKYIVSADVARGDGLDYSTFQVLDLDTCEQVAEYKGKVMPRPFAYNLVSIATSYNNALLVIENNNVGWSTVEEVVSLEYSNLYYSTKNLMETPQSFIKKQYNGGLTPGFSMSMKVRPIVVAKLAEYLESKGLGIRSSRLIEELFVFVWKNGRPEAQKGYNDDLVFAAAVALYVRDTTIKYQNAGISSTRDNINSMIRFNNKERYNRVHLATQRRRNSPFIVSDGHGGEMDVSWLLGQKPVIDDGW